MSLAAIWYVEEILHQLIGSLSHYLQGFIHPGGFSPDSFHGPRYETQYHCQISMAHAPCNSQLSCWLWSSFWSSAFGRRRSGRRFGEDVGVSLTSEITNCTHFTGWFQCLFLFSHPTYLGEMIQFDEYFSDGLKAPTSLLSLSSTESKCTAKEITWDHQRSGDDVFHECWVI